MNLLIYIKLLIIFNIILLSKRSPTSLLSKRKKKKMKEKNTTRFHRKWKLVHSDRKQRTGAWGPGVGRKERLQKALGNVCGDGYVYYLDCGDDGFTGLYICQNLPICTLLNMCSLWYVSYTSIRLKKESNISHRVIMNI